MPRCHMDLPEIDRPDIYQEVTDTIIAELEAGCLPWVQPWSDEAVALRMPCNAITERCYSGVNIMLLWRAARRGSYRSPYWLTFRQAIEAGGHVRKGERGTSVVLARRYTPEGEQQRADEAGEDARSFGFLRRFTLFNAQQCDGLDPRFVPEVEQDLAPEGEMIARSEELIAASGVDFTSGTVEAFYSAHDDMVHIPSWSRFQDPLDRERICLHELVHATGHSSRVGRDMNHEFGSSGYAREELIAELGAAYVCAALGIPPTVRHANYIGCWLEELRGDKRAIFKAASAAAKAADWLIDRHVAQAVGCDRHMEIEEAEQRMADKPR